jgi:hypothetical protein
MSPPLVATTDEIRFAVDALARVLEGGPQRSTAEIST